MLYAINMDDPLELSGFQAKLLQNILSDCGFAEEYLYRILNVNACKNLLNLMYSLRVSQILDYNQMRNSGYLPKLPNF